MRFTAPILLALAMVLPGCATLGGGRGASHGEIQLGTASYYAARHQGHRTASGERYDAEALTAAHRTLPFGTRVRVTNLENRRSVTVTVTDRGPFRRGRIIDLSRRAARELEFLRQGVARVRVEVVGLGR